MLKNIKASDKQLALINPLGETVGLALYVWLHRIGV